MTIAAAPTWDESLIHKYNRSGPRYTSYPTALEFSDIPEGEEAQLLSRQESERPLSLYFHIPFCAHLCFYCACNKVLTKKRDKGTDYLPYLYAEMDWKKQQLGGNQTVEQLHFGGGTPTFLSDDELTQLWQRINATYTLSQADSADYSIEIDPRELRETTLQTLRELGFNRLSFGVQDLNEIVQRAVNRLQPESMIRDVMQQARALNYRSINMDLIYGLPHQTLETLTDTVDRILDMQPDRLSVFNYAHLPSRFKPQVRILAEDLPEPSVKLDMLGMCIEKLAQAGYQYIGMDHFAKIDDELARAQRAGQLHRNFQGYTTHGNCDLIGHGVSSISQIGNTFLQNSSDFETYKSMIDRQASPAVRIIHSNSDDIIRHDVIMSLLCHDEVRFADIDQQHNITATDYFADEIATLREMADDHLLTLSDQAITILPRGRLLARSVAMVFDTYLAKKEKDRFSKVI